MPKILICLLSGCPGPVAGLGPGGHADNGGVSLGRWRTGVRVLPVGGVSVRAGTWSPAVRALLLNRFSTRTLEMPSRSFCCCQASTTPHLAIAVRYNRINILKMIMATIKDLTDCERRSYLNRHGCVHTDGSKTVLHLACDLLRPECLVLLLGHGACPYATDLTGNTPLDCLLSQICQSDFDMRTKRICLGYPHFIHAHYSLPDEETIAGQWRYVEGAHRRAGLPVAFRIITSFAVRSGHA